MAWRNNTGAKGRVRFGLGVGSADIICCVGPYGRFVAFEAKARDGRLSEAQKDWGRALQICGGLYWVIYEPEDVIRGVYVARKAA